MMASIFFGGDFYAIMLFGVFLASIGASSMISTGAGLFLSFAKQRFVIKCCLQPLSPAPISLWQSGHLLACPGGFHGWQASALTCSSYSEMGMLSRHLLHCLNMLLCLHSFSKWEFSELTSTTWPHALQFVSIRQYDR